MFQKKDRRAKAVMTEESDNSTAETDTAQQVAEPSPVELPVEQELCHCHTDVCFSVCLCPVCLCLT